MENIVITQINAKCVRIVPASGHKLLDVRTGTEYSEAYVRPKEADNYRAVSVE